ncbi:hypothetical protein TB1_022215 [Malus domestica]
MGFCDAWVNIVMHSVSSVQFFVLFNGQPGKSFKPSRGMRQGDPLSLYLFFIVSEVLSRLLKRATNFQFLDGKPQNSTVYFSVNTSVALAHELSGILEMPVVEDLGTYLGVPTMWGRSKHDALAFIKERILAKILGWKQQFLSKEGKEVLIKAVSLAIPTYPMNCWRFLYEPESLWVKVLKDRYFPQDSFFTAKLGERGLWVWSSLLEGRDLIIRGSKWQVLSGNSINLWKDNWVPGILNSRPIPKDGWEIDKTRVVASIIDTERRTWNEDEIGDLFFESAKAAISRIHIEDSCSPDRLIWPASKTGPYSVISGYWWLRNSTPARKLDRPSTSHSVLPQLGSSESKSRFLSQVAFSCWFIWKARCDAVFNGLSPSPSHTIFNLSSAWKAFTDANSRIHDLAPSPRNNHLCEVSWYTPHPSVLKINVDASWRHGASSTWVGLVIHDSRCLEVRRMEVLASFAAMDESLVVLEGCLLAKGLFFELRLGTLPNPSLYLVGWEGFPSLLLVLDSKISKLCGRLRRKELHSGDVQLCLGLQDKDGLPCFGSCFFGMTCSLAVAASIVIPGLCSVISSFAALAFAAFFVLGWPLCLGTFIYKIATGHKNGSSLFRLDLGFDSGREMTRGERGKGDRRVERERFAGISGRGFLGGTCGWVVVWLMHRSDGCWGEERRGTEGLTDWREMGATILDSVRERFR